MDGRMARGVSHAGLVLLLLAAGSLTGCTTTAGSAAASARPASATASTPAGPCSRTRPPGYVHVRPDGSKPFGASFTHGRDPLDNESAKEPDCMRSLMVRVEREGVFRPTRVTLVSGHHRVYRLYRVTVRNGLPGTVWPIDLFGVIALDGTRSADRAVDTHRRIGTPPSDALETGRSVSWLEAFSDDAGDQTVLITPYRAGLDGGPQTADIFTER